MRRPIDHSRLFAVAREEREESGRLSPGYVVFGCLLYFRPFSEWYTCTLPRAHGLGCLGES